MRTVHNNTDRFWAAFNISSFKLLYALLPCSQTAHSSQCHNIFQKLFPHKLGGQRRECLSWATSHDVAVKVAIITHFGQAASSCSYREGRLWVSNDFIFWGGVQSALKTGICAYSGGLPTHLSYCQAFSKLMRAHTRGEILQLHSYLQYKYRNTDRVCMSFTYSTGHMCSWHLNWQH